jgi:hypothetical protein
MKQHKTHQASPTDLALARDGVSAALADLAAECRLLLEQNTRSSNSLLEEIWAALYAGASLTDIKSLLSSAAAEEATEGTMVLPDSRDTPPRGAQRT